MNKLAQRQYNEENTFDIFLFYSDGKTVILTFVNVCHNNIFLSFARFCFINKINRIIFNNKQNKVMIE